MSYYNSHGRSVSNCTATDEPLSAEGHRQVEHVAEKLAPVGIGANCKIYHSPLVRARHTAQGLFPNGQHIELDFLREESPWEIITCSNGLDKRIHQFQTWLLDVPTDIVVVVGHSRFFRRMVGMDRVLDNCSVALCTFETGRDYEQWTFKGVLYCADNSPDCDNLLDQPVREAITNRIVNVE